MYNKNLKPFMYNTLPIARDGMADIFNYYNYG